MTTEPDPQARAAEEAAKAIHNVPGIECDHIDGKQPTCERDAAHVAAALAEAGLLADRDFTDVVEVGIRYKRERNAARSEVEALTARLVEQRERIAREIENDPALRLGHQVSVICSCLRCEVAKGAARIARGGTDGV